jgi:hypothetical protein
MYSELSYNNMFITRTCMLTEVACWACFEFPAMSQPFQAQGQNGFPTQANFIAPPQQQAFTFTAPSQPFTASAPPTAPMTVAPTPAPLLNTAIPSNIGASTSSAAPPAVGQGLAMPPTAPDQGRSLRKRPPTEANGTNGTGGGSSTGGAAERTTRSGTSFSARPKWMPKLKLKVSESSDGRKQSFLGPYDRDLDSDDEELVFEEHFILRMPEGKEADRLRDMVNKRGAMSDVWFKFKGQSYPHDCF